MMEVRSLSTERCGRGDSKCIVRPGGCWDVAGVGFGFDFLIEGGGCFCLLSSR